jgi:hypothetical protein
MPLLIQLRDQHNPPGQVEAVHPRLDLHGDVSQSALIVA